MSLIACGCERHDFSVALNSQDQCFGLSHNRWLDMDTFPIVPAVPDKTKMNGVGAFGNERNEKSRNQPARSVNRSDPKLKERC